MSVCTRHRCSHNHMHGLYNLDHEPKHSASSTVSECDVCVCVGKVLSRDLTQQLNNAIQFLVHCRPLSISMGNAIKYVKLQASHLLSVAYQLSFAYQRHSVTQPQSISNAIKYFKLQASHLLSFAYQIPFWPQSTSMGSCVKYVKLHASPLLRCPVQSQSVTHLKERGSTASTSNSYAAAKTTYKL